MRRHPTALRPGAASRRPGPSRRCLQPVAPHPPGYRAHVMMIPDLALGIAVLTNSHAGQSLPPRVGCAAGRGAGPAKR